MDRQHPVARLKPLLAVRIPYDDEPQRKASFPDPRNHRIEVSGALLWPDRAEHADVTAFVGRQLEHVGECTCRPGGLESGPGRCEIDLDARIVFSQGVARPLRILVLGRISRIKGQDLLIEALALLPKAITQRLEVRIVGESFQNDAPREAALHQAVTAAGLDAIVRFEPFQDDTAPLYRWTDIVVVPSRLPESLGRVAIEAMAHGRPPLVARIGGLTEIVQDGVTGWVVPPNDAGVLARTIAAIATEPDLWRGYGAAARARFEATFAARNIARQFQAIVRARFGAENDQRAAAGLARV